MLLGALLGVTGVGVLGLSVSFCWHHPHSAFPIIADDSVLVLWTWAQMLLVEAPQSVVVIITLFSRADVTPVYDELYELGELAVIAVSSPPYPPSPGPWPWRAVVEHHLGCSARMLTSMRAPIYRRGSVSKEM